MRKRDKDKMLEQLNSEYYSDEISNHITYRMWLEDELIKYKLGKGEVVNGNVSHKLSCISHSISNWRLVVFSSVIGTIVGSIATAICFACC